MAHHVLEADPNGLVGGSPVGMEAQGTDAAGVDHPFDPVGSGRLQNVSCTPDVGFIDFLGVSTPQAVIGGHVKHHVTAFHGVLHLLKAANVPGSPLHPGRGQIGVAGTGTGQGANGESLFQQA